MLTWGELHTESMLALINSTYSNQPPMPVPHSSQSMFMICCVSSPHSSQSQAQSQEDGAGLQLHPSGSRPSLFFSSKMVGPEHTTPIGATSSLLANPVGPKHATSVGSFDFDFFPFRMEHSYSNLQSLLAGVLMLFAMPSTASAHHCIYLATPAI